MRTRLRTAMTAALVIGLTGCTPSSSESNEPNEPKGSLSSKGPDEGAAGRPAPAAMAVTGTRLTAELVTPVDITLKWTGEDRGAAGRIVEFATDPAGPYTILEYLTPGSRTFRHPDLMPLTPFHYRLRPYYGQASPPVEVALPPGDLTEKDQQGDHEWAPPRTVRGKNVPTRPVRSAGSAPSDLKATVEHANGIKFTWTDHAENEAGYLLETRTAGSRTFRPTAVLDPDINSFGLITLPNEKKASYRVRVISYGKQSNVVHLKTGESR